MALAIPVLGLGSSLKPLHTSTHASHSSAPSSLAIPTSCRLRASPVSGCHRTSACRALIHGHEIASNSGVQSSELDVLSLDSVKGETHFSGSGRNAEEPVVSSPALRRVFGVSALAVAGLVMSAGASLADEVAASPVDGSDAGISTTVSVLFVAATVGLVVLTGGVIYLGLSDFLEKRALQEEQKKVEAEKPKEKKLSKQADKAAARAGGPKGFGSGRRTGTKGDDEEVSN